MRTRLSKTVYEYIKAGHLKDYIPKPYHFKDQGMIPIILPWTTTTDRKSHKA